MNFANWTIYLGNLGGVGRNNYGQTVSPAMAAVLARLLSTGGLLNIAGTDMIALHLYSNNYTPNINTLISQMTECTFAGYAAVDTTAWGAATLQTDGSWLAAMNPQATFVATTTTPTETIYGMYLTDANGDLFAAYKLPSPIALSAVGDGLIVSTTLQIGP